MNYYNPWNAQDRSVGADDVAALREDVERRLGPVCAHLPVAEFRALVDEICRIKVKFAGG